jgi:prephenate dehydratase
MFVFLQAVWQFLKRLLAFFVMAKEQETGLVYQLTKKIIILHTVTPGMLISYMNILGKRKIYLNILAKLPINFLIVAA